MSAEFICTEIIYIVTIIEILDACLEILPSCSLLNNDCQSLNDFIGTIEERNNYFTLGGRKVEYCSYNRGVSVVYDSSDVVNILYASLNSRSIGLYFLIHCAVLFSSYSCSLID